MKEAFFELIQVAVETRGCLSKVPSEKDWENLYSHAQQQALSGVCFYGIQKLPQRQFLALPLSLKMQWLGTVVQIQKRNELIDQRCMELQETLSNAGFRTYIMKGQGNAMLYGKDLCSLRQSGDIDIYLEGGYDKVIDYVNRTFPTKEVNELEIHYHCFKDAEVEIHYKPFVMDGPKDKILQRFFAEEAEKCFTNKISLSQGEICTSTCVFNLVHQLVHIHHHLFYEGIGLRQLMDYYFVLKDANESEIDIARAKNTISSLGLTRFASALMWVLEEVFGINKEQMLWTPNEKDGTFLLHEIMCSGNFGQSDKNLKGIYQSKWKSFWFVHSKTFRYWRFDNWAWFWSPVIRIKNFSWRKINGYK